MHTSESENLATYISLEVEEKMKTFCPLASNIASKKVPIVIISLEKWREITPMKTPRSTGFSLIFKNKIYVFGGYTGDKKRSKSI